MADGLALAETAELMLSENYKDRFKAEYHQLKTRRKSLENMLKRWDGNTLDFTPECPRGLLELQIEAMKQYETVLETRATIEKITL